VFRLLNQRPSSSLTSEEGNREIGSSQEGKRLQISTGEGIR
jgi:hypothetical protein